MLDELLQRLMSQYHQVLHDASLLVALIFLVLLGIIAIDVLWNLWNKSKY